MAKAPKLDANDERVQNEGGYYKVAKGKETAEQRSIRYASGMQAASDAGDEYRAKHLKVEDIGHEVRDHTGEW